eukprot:scaffold4174_cov150-Skeletonema_menzelii.AAC.17
MKKPIVTESEQIRDPATTYHRESSIFNCSSYGYFDPRLFLPHSCFDPAPENTTFSYLWLTRFSRGGRRAALSAQPHKPP